MQLMPGKVYSLIKSARGKSMGLPERKEELNLRLEPFKPLDERASQIVTDGQEILRVFRYRWLPKRGKESVKVSYYYYSDRLYEVELASDRELLNTAYLNRYREVCKEHIIKLLDFFCPDSYPEKQELKQMLDSQDFHPFEPLDIEWNNEDLLLQFRWMSNQENADKKREWSIGD